MRHRLRRLIRAEIKSAMLACKSRAYRCSRIKTTKTHLHRLQSAQLPIINFKAVQTSTALSHLDQLRRRLQMLRLLRSVVVVPSNPYLTPNNKPKNCKRRPKLNRMPWWDVSAVREPRTQSEATVTMMSLRAWSMASTTIRPS